MFICSFFWQTNFMKKEEKIVLYLILCFSMAIFLIYLVLLATKNTGLAHFDDNIARFFYNHRIRFFDYVFVLISYIGETVSIVTLCFILLILPNRKKVGIPVTIITLFAAILNFTLKYSIKRIRPEGLFLTEPTLFYSMPDGYSFPSGHAMQGVVFFMALALTLSQQTRKVWQEILLTITGMTLSVLTCVARIYLCVHYFSDVFCGFAAALAILSLGYLIKLKQKPKHIITLQGISQNYQN